MAAPQNPFIFLNSANCEVKKKKQKKMLNEEDIESWNTFFPNGRVQEADLKQPTETFLVRAFVAYLQAFGYKVEPPLDAERLREKRLFMVRLAQNVDHILKFTDKSYDFFYYDLIKPGPKKTSKVLGILLNYFKFFKMFELEIFELVNDGTKAQKEFLHKIQEAEKENQRRKERAQQITKEITTLSKAVPIAKAEFDALVTKTNVQQEQMRKEQDAVEDLNKKINDLRSQERDFRKQIVDDNEALKLKSELTDLQTNIEKNLLKKNDMEKNLNERLEVIKNLNDLMIRLEEAKNISLSPLLEEYKEISKKIKQSKIFYKDISVKKQALLDLVTKQESELKNKEEKYKIKQQEFEKEKAEKSKSNLEKETLCSSEQLELKNLKNQLRQVNDLIEEHKNMLIFLKVAVSEILSRYNVESKCFKF